jgi:hypothetical protein
MLACVHILKLKVILVIDEIPKLNQKDSNIMSRHTHEQLANTFMHCSGLCSGFGNERKMEPKGLCSGSTIKRPKQTEEGNSWSLST